MFSPLQSCKNKYLKTILTTIILISVTFSFAYSQNISRRNTISLDGIWQIAEGSMDTIPKSFNHTVTVPGLVSLFIPAFKNTGPKIKDRKSIFPSDSLREVFLVSPCILFMQ